MGSCCGKTSLILSPRHPRSDTTDTIGPSTSIPLELKPRAAAWFFVTQFSKGCLTLSEIATSENSSQHIRVRMAAVHFPQEDPPADHPDSARNKEKHCARLTLEHLERFLLTFENRVFCVFLSTEAIPRVQMYVRYNNEMLSVQRFLTYFGLAKKSVSEASEVSWMQCELDEILAKAHLDLTSTYLALN